MTHDVIQGDCLDVLPTLASQTIDVVITDPPFNIGKAYNTYVDNKSRDEYIEWCEQWLGQCIRTLKPGGALYLINYPENNARLIPYLDAEMTFRRWLVWHFPAHITSPGNYTRSHYSILYYTKGEPAMFNRKDILEPYKNLTDARIKKLIKKGFTLSEPAGRTPWDVLDHDIVRNTSKEKTSHPCQIPLDILEMFIRASSNKGDTILDPFGGSGSTAAAAKRVERDSVTIEMDTAYIKVINARLRRTSPVATLEGLFEAN